MSGMSNHSFIKEVIKEKPLDKRKLMIKIIMLIVAAVLFGVIAAVVFAYTRPAVEKSIETRKGPNSVNIAGGEEDEGVTPTPSRMPTPTPIPEVTPQEEPEEASVEAPPEPAELGLPEYKKLYKDMKDISQNAEKSIVTVIGIKSEIDYFRDTYDNRGQRSGLIVANNGRELLVLTEYSVIDGVDKIQIAFPNGTTADAQYQKHDENSGLTIVKVLLEEVDAATMDSIITAPLGNSNKLTQGEPVIALGSPTGSSESIAFGSTTSVINKIAVWDTAYSLITTDILGVESGSGVLLNLDGEIVGIMAQNYSNENNTVTALAISPIRNLIQTLSNNGALYHLGIKGKEVTEDISNDTGIPQGIWIETSKQDSPAMRAGLMGGDVIIKLNDEEVRTIAEYNKELNACQVGTMVQVIVMRNGADGYEEIPFDVMVEAL